MKTYTVDRIRNVGLFSHGGAGKTTLTEASAFITGATNRLGRVEDGTTISDWDPDEARRGMSISTSVVPIEWRDHKINFVDAPGYAEFAGEVMSAMRVCDTALILIDAASGVEVGTESAWKLATRNERPRAILINKMDRENADFAESLRRAREAFGDNVVPAYLPIGAEDNFRGVIDLLENKAYGFPDDPSDDYPQIEIPAEMADEVEAARTELVERICEVDEDLMMRYLEDDEISLPEFRTALRQSLAAGQVVPVFVAAAVKCQGTRLILDAIVDDFPPPACSPARVNGGDEATLEPDPNGPVAALVFKTVADPYVGKISYFRTYSGTVTPDSHLQVVQNNSEERLGQLHVMRGKEQITVDSIPPGDIGAVTKLDSAATGSTLCNGRERVELPGIEFPEATYSAAVFPHTKGDLDKLGTSIHRLIDEDPSLRVTRDADSGETIVSGLGESHVQIGLQRMSRKFGVNVDLDLPAVPYRETITQPVKGVEYKHKKQTGGHGQYGHVFFDLEPYDEGEFLFEETIVGGVVPKNFIPAVEKGVREALEDGLIAGYPVVNVKVTLVDGSYHSVDSSEMAFKVAAQQAFKKAAMQANPTLLEPVMHLHVTVPESYMGDVMSDLNAKRGQVQGMTPGDDGLTTIEAYAPQAEIQRYATDLRSITQGRGSFTAEFSHYQQVPPHLNDGIIERAKARQEAHQ